MNSEEPNVHEKVKTSAESTGIDFIGLLNPASTAAALGDSSPVSTLSNRSGRLLARRRRMPGLLFLSLADSLSMSVLLTLVSSLRLSPPRLTNSSASGSACRLASSTAAASSATVPVSRWAESKIGPC